jgi:integrase
MIGNMKLKDVKVSHCNKILNDMAGFSKDRINKVQNCLKQMFEMAVIDDKLIKSPAMKLSPPKAVDGTHRSITPYERKITLQVANHHPAGSWVLTMLYCGLRPQETAALKGRHIDKKNMIIHIDQALKRDGIIDVTKTSAGRRIVPLHPELLKYFEKIDSDDFVFKSKKGKPLNNNNWGTMWKSFKREMQIVAGCEVYRNKLIPPFPIAEDLVPYCYRHTFATDLQDADIHINVAKDLIGHANISVTADIYTHMTEEQLQKSAQSIVKYSKKLQRRARHFRALNNTSIQRFKIGNISHV